MAQTPPTPKNPWKKAPLRGTSTAASIRAGLLLGALAGGVFLVAVFAVWSLAGRGLLEPLRFAASILLGRAALNALSPLAVGIAGLGVHFSLSAFFGAAYGFVDSTLAPEERPHALHQMGLGGLFGAALWVINSHFLARQFLPWFLDLPQFTGLVLHALAFGLPLGWLFAEAERRHQFLRGDAVRPLGRE